MSFSRSAHCLLFSVALVASGQGLAVGEFDNLLKNSPFGTPAVRTSEQEKFDTGLEFRGILSDGGEKFFSLHDLRTQTASWVGLNEPGFRFLVRHYDPARSTVEVECEGRLVTLALKPSKILPLIPAPAGSGDVTGAAPTASPDEEQVRAAKVMAEVRQRRLLRQQAIEAAANAPVVPDPAARK